MKYTLFSKKNSEKFCQTVFFLVLCKSKCAMSIIPYNLNALTNMAQRQSLCTWQQVT